jgi:hypothetical protein
MDLESPLQCRSQILVFKADKFSPQHTIPPYFFRIKDCKSTEHETLLNPETVQVKTARWRTESIIAQLHTVFCSHKDTVNALFTTG